MAQLTDLPSETLLQIVSYLKPEPEKHVGPFHHWSRVLQTQVDEARSRTRTIHALSLSCRRLYGLFAPVLYSYIPLTREAQLPLLLQLCETDSPLADHITSAVVPGHDAIQLQPLFWLNIHTLSVQGFKGYQSLEWEGLDHIGTSPVRKLRLSDCGAHEAALKDLLSWPSALEELWYEADQIEWAPGFEAEGEEVPDYTTSAIERCLASQAGSLQKLVFSRPVQDHEGLGYCEGIDLRGYEKLRSLSINHAFLIGFDPNTNVWERLPKSLVELDVFYDDSGYINFWRDAERPEWLFDLLGKKQQFFPVLERVRILSCEGVGDEEEDGAEGDQPEWSPVGDLIPAFVRANVSLMLYLNKKRRYEHVANGKVWDDDWEETEDMYNY